MDCARSALQRLLLCFFAPARLCKRSKNSAAARVISAKKDAAAFCAADRTGESIRCVNTVPLVVRNIPRGEIAPTVAAHLRPLNYTYQK
jgi:hypothetical protein